MGDWKLCPNFGKENKTGTVEYHTPSPTISRLKDYGTENKNVTVEYHTPSPTISRLKDGVRLPSGRVDVYCRLEWSDFVLPQFQNLAF